MSKFCLIWTFVFFAHLQTRGQYDYFNIVFPGESPNGEGSWNLILEDSTYLSIGGLATLEGTILRFKRLDRWGNVILQHDSLFTDQGFSAGTADDVIEIGGDILASIVNRFDQTKICGVAEYSPTFDIVRWIPYLEATEDTDQVVVNTLLRVDDDYMVAGSVSFDTIPYNSGIGGDSYAMYLMKIDTSGNRLWSAFLHHSETEYFLGDQLFRLANGEVLLTGRYGESDDPDALLLKTDTEASFFEEYIWGTNNCGEGMPQAVPNDNATFSVVYQECVDQEVYQIIELHRLVNLHFMVFNPMTMLPEFDAELNIPFLEEWVKGFGIGDMCRTEDGGLACTLLMRDLDYGEHNYILKLNAQGEIEWLKEYFCPEGTECAIPVMQDIEPALDGGLIVTGFVNLEPTLAQRHWLLKVDACGDVENLGCSYPYVEVRDILPPKPELQLWPNPANDKITILAPKGGINLVTIYDLSGSLIVQQKITGHGETLAIDISAFSSGVYYVMCYSHNEPTGNLKFIKQ